MPASATSASASVVLAVRQGIQHGRFLPGQRLRERELGEQCGVGRSSVREAFRTLASDGLIVTAPRRSPVIRQFTQAEVIAQFELREVLEGLAASLAAMGGESGTGRQRLRECHGHVGEAVAARDHDAFLKHNGEFHAAIMQMSGNTFIADHVERTQIMPLRLQSARLATTDSMAQSHEDHHAIVEAIVAGDAQGAQAAMRGHIARTRHALLSAHDLFTPPA